jgi:hypothetical protein
MILKILASQVPTFWEAIKFAALSADEVEEKNRQAYLNEILHSLLSDKAQCFVFLDDDRVLIGLMVTRVQVDKITDEKALLLQALYVWKRPDTQVWIDGFNYVKQFALSQECKSFSFSSRNPALWARAAEFGAIEKTRTFTLQLI